VSSNESDIRVRLFSPYLEAAGERELHLDFGEYESLRDVLQELRHRFPGLEKYFTSCPDGTLKGYSFTCLVDGTAVGPDHQLRGGEKIMVLPPMEGG
jgi:molybdopterin converting factor small subunit